MRGKTRLTGVGSVATLVLAVVLVAGSVVSAAGLPQETHATVAQPESVEYDDLPEPAGPGVDADWWSTVQGNILRSEYHVTWQEQTYLADLAAAYQAPNRAQNLRTYFTPEGPIVIPRTWAEETSTPPWRWGVRLVGWGHEAVSEPPRAELEVDQNRIEYQRGDSPSGPESRLLEWYRNDEDGLAQGFTLPAPGGSSQPGMPVHLNLRLNGDLSPTVLHDGAVVEFRAADGRAGLVYGGLQARDATGNPLAARLMLEGSILSIEIEAEEAEYPLTVEVSITGLSPSSDWTKSFGQAGAEFGTSVATAGDVDGDGYSEVIIGAPNYDAGLGGEGGVFVYAGSSGGLWDVVEWYKVFDQADANFGYSVATAGDVNGDGYSDVIIGAPGYSHHQAGEGGTWVYHGSAGGLEDAWSTHDEGNQAGAAFGASVATAGDVNGDGYSDVIVGAPLYNNGSSEEGMAWVWHGSSGGLSETHNWHAEANQTDASFGQSVATAGDVNMDGFADIIVGATRYTSGADQDWEGAAFVWLGSAAGVNGGVHGNPTNDHRHLQINQAAARFGWEVSTAGDVNGDGYSDVIVGAPYYTNGQASEGAARIYLGSDSGVIGTYANHDEGNQARAHFGWSVGTAGDVNGDGRADVIVGAPDYTVGLSDQGRAWLWYGQATDEGISLGYDWRSAGGHAEDYFGTSVATAGDVNGDGYSDVLIGAPGCASSAGCGYVYHGGSDPLAETAGWPRRSNQAHALFGFAVGTAGDVNADGYADIIVGAPRWDAGQENEGAAWVYLGTETGLYTGAPHWYRQGNRAGGEFGSAVGTAGDVNGDRYDDVIVGAPLWSNPQLYEGAAFVYPGSATGLSETGAPIWSKASNQEGAKFGTSVATAGDVNGDGYADIVVGAPFWQSGGDELGGAWLYYGAPGGTHSAPDWYQVGDQLEAEYGHAVASAGDVNADGYSDVIVGAPEWEDNIVGEGRAVVYLGSATGLSHAESWYAEGNNFVAGLGYSVSTAGDVNGDGYSDVIVGGPDYGDDYGQEGKVWVFHGAGDGLRPAHSWSREGGQTGAQYGISVGTAGDVNGDGYADVIIGIELWNGGLTNEGGASVYHGGYSGLGSSRTWHGEGEQTSAHYGASVGSAGDVNGDGYADVVVGAPNYNSSSELADEGIVYVYYGNGGPGTDLRLRQFNSHGTVIPRLGKSDDESYRLGVRYRSPFGRGQFLSEVETKPLGQRFDGEDTFIPGGTLTWNEMIPGNGTTMSAGHYSYGMGYHWRTRFLYNPATTPFMPASRWVTVPWNGWNELDLRTAGSRVLLPMVMRNYWSP